MTKSTTYPPRTPAYFRLCSVGCRLGEWFLVSNGHHVPRHRLLIDHGWTNHDLNVIEAAVLLLEHQPLATRSSADRAAIARRRRHV